MKNAAFWAGRTIRETFDSHWKEDPKTGCHLWQRSLQCAGYGQLNIGGRPMLAHRFSWTRTHGLIPSGMQVMHRCDNPRCVRIDHLELGTNLDNILDKRSKGRERPGSLWRSRKRSKPKRKFVAQTFDDHWRLDERTGCWVWQLWRSPDGYGIVLVAGRKVRAHRFAYERARGPVPRRSVVRHKCDNPGCVNPDHLIVGSQRDNVADMVDRGRQRGAVGERNKKAKLTAEKVVAIRSRFDEGGITKAELGKLFGISNVQASNIVRRVSWGHVQ